MKPSLMKDSPRKITEIETKFSARDWEPSFQLPAINFAVSKTNNSLGSKPKE
jgi:hypothetical protein